MPLAPPGARSVARRVALLALAASLTTCRVDKLTNPATADRLTVDQDSLVASANVGSLVPETTTVRVGSADGVALTWTATKKAAWVTLIPSPDSLVVELHPDTLSQTLHRDTIVFTSPQSVETVRVPIVFTMLPPAAELVVTPMDRDAAPFRDTAAFVGSAQPDTFSLRIRNKGALPLTWAATLNASWVTLSDSGGTVPAQDTTSTIVLVTLRPESLSTGTQNGRIIFTAPGAIGSPDTVPITYTIRPCEEAGITLDTVVTGSIALSDCGAPQRPGRQAKLYAVQATLGDTLSFRLTAAFNAFLVLTNSTGVAVLDSNDVCVEVNTACITNFAVPATGRYVIEATTADSGETGAFTLSAVKELRPSAPAAGQFRADSATAIAVGAVTPEGTVVFKATLNDPNPRDSVRLEVEVEGLATGPQIYVSSFVLRGTPVALPVSGLNDNEGYHWRARTCDKTARCSAWVNFGGNPETEADFFVNTQPQDPTLTGPGQFGPGGGAIPVGGGTGGTLGGSVTVTFRATVTDPDPRDLISIEVEYKRTGVAFNESNLTRGTGVSSGGTAAVAVSFGVPLLLTDDYHWRARACDQTNRCGAWVPFGGNLETATDFHVP